MFNSHGELVLHIDGNILKVVGKGPFNIEAVDKYETDLLASFASFPGPWGQLNTMDANCIYTPQAKAKMSKITQLRKDNRLVAVAFVCEECTGNSLLFEQLTVFYEDWELL